MPASQGKIARQDIAELVVALLEAPAASDTTFEVKTTQPFSQPFVADPSAPPRDWQARHRRLATARNALPAAGMACAHFLSPLENRSLVAVGSSPAYLGAAA